MIDPYVQIEVHGLPCDANDKLFSTKTIHNNGELYCLSVYTVYNYINNNNNARIER